MIHRNFHQRNFVHQVSNHQKVVRIHQTQNNNTGESSSSSSHSSSSSTTTTTTTRLNNVRKRITLTNGTQISSINKNKVFMKASNTVLTMFRDLVRLLGGILFAKSSIIFLILVRICMSSIIFKSFCGMSERVTRVVICKHFTLKDNETDLLSKANIQETFITLLGMILGLLFTYTLHDETSKNSSSVAIIWFVFLLLTLIHVISNWYAVKSLNSTTLNGELAIISIPNYILNKFNKNKLATCKYVSEKENACGVFHIRYFKHFSNLKLYSYLLSRWLRDHYTKSVYDDTYDDIYGDGKAYIEFGPPVYLVTKDWMSWNVQGLKSNDNNTSNNKTDKSKSTSGENNLLILHNGEIIYLESKVGVILIVIQCSTIQNIKLLH